jgi:extracellular elastinolytic metalloproteinase
MRAWRGVMLAALGAALVQAAPALAVGDQAKRGLPDVDVRAGKIAPSAGQRAEVRDLGGAQVSWNRFGTPSSLVDRGGTLGAAVRGATAAEAARAWVQRNLGLFRLSSTKGLQLAGDARLAGDAGHAVSFRQVVGGLPAAGGGLLTVGLTRAGGGWRVVSASSTISGDESLASGARLSAPEAWQRAAAGVGAGRSLAQIRRAGAKARASAKGWTTLQVAGLAGVQRARDVAFPTVGRGYVPAYETLVLDTASTEPAAYRLFVDARSGSVLARDDLVDSEADPASAVAAPSSFTGTLPAQDGACDARQGPYTVAAGDGVRAIDVFANADNPANDIVLRLYRGDALVAEADTLKTPERIRYTPQGGVPAGDYFVAVCDFGDGTPPADPRTYSATVGLDTSAPPVPYVARWRAFRANPPLAQLDQDPWNLPSTDIRANLCWQGSPTAGDCDRVVGNLASRSPWDYDPKANAVTGTTIGNNARTAESWTDASQPAANQFRPTSPNRDYSFPWTNAWAASDCNPGDPYGSAFQVGRYPDVAAAVTNLFTVHNRMHDWSYLLGFTEQNWNAQSSNFGLTEAYRENDPVVGDAQAGAALPPPGVYGNARDNANMTTLPDGSSSVTNMYLWQPLAGSFYAPCVDGDFDAGVIGHEYTHMIENRMIGKGATRTGFQAGAMGEGNGDLLSLEMLNETGSVPTDGENPYATGAYATGNKVRGIRNYAPNFPATGVFPAPSVYPRVDPLNFSDVGYDLTGPEVHADGEIWVAINFELRRALAAKYDAQFPSSNATLQQRCAAGTLPVESCPGNRRWVQLLLDAYLLMPTSPTMVDARNAILAADLLRFGGADLTELWAAFARRGLGRFASQTTTSGRVAGVESDTNPLPDFEAPFQGNATVTFDATSRETGAPAVKARIFVGHYEARVSPVADTDPATNAPATATANNLDPTATFAPGTYEFIATAPGYGAVRFRRTFSAGTATTLNLHFSPNWASSSQGATASGDVTPVTSAGSQPPGAEVQSSAQVLRNLIDDTEATDWQTAASPAGPGYAVEGKAVTVDLAGSRPQTIGRVQVSALLGPVFDPKATRPADLSQNRFTALRQFEVWSCNDQFADCSTDDGFNRVYTSPADAFPADVPRPVAPMLQLRTFVFSPVRATHLRLRVRASQCTGGPAYQGEQDADPFNATDCDTAGPAATRYVRAAEFEAFTSASGVTTGTG